MAMRNIKSRSAIIVILAALLMGSLSSAAWTFQQPRRTPASEDQRKRALERVTEQAKDAQPAPAIPAIPPAASSAPGQSGKVLLNIENADLYDFINEISSTLGLTPIVIDSEVKGSVNILSSSPISKEELMPLFTMILKNNNAALIRQGNTYQIVPISTALKRGVDIIEKLPPASSDSRPAEEEERAVSPKASKEPASSAAVRTSAAPAQASAKSALGPAQARESEAPGAARLATHVIRAEFVPVRDLIEPIKLFMTEGGVIMPYERLNMLILTDYTDSVDRILQIVRMLDNNYLDPDLVELVKINNNASADVAEDLKKMFGTGAKDSATGISLISLDRLNAIFVMASSRRGLEEVKGWIKELDSSSAKNIQTYVYVVENSTASSIAMMLSALYGGEGFSSSTSGGVGTGTSGGGAFGSARNPRSQTGDIGSGTGITSGTAGGAASSPFAGQSYQGGQFGQSGSTGYGYMGGGIFGAGRQLGPQLNPQRSVTSQILRGGEFTGLQGTVRLVVDDVNNSLIIQATPADYAYVSETIRKMDVLPRQALIDAKIYEVDLTDSLNFGIAATLQANKGGDRLTTGELSPSGLLTATTFVPVGSAREIMAMLEALRLKTKVRILEAPSVLALDGQMAEIVVGSEIPYPESSFIPSVGGSTTSVGYRNTGISLLVIPRISASGNVTLDIMQEVSAPGANVTIGDGSAPSFSKTSVTTTLSVKDGETVAIAGLIRDGDDFSRSGIPFLSDIPLVGALFGQTSRNSRRSELIILITPHVIRTPEKLEEKTQELRDSLRHVRKYADEKERQYTEDMEDARKERYEQERKNMKEIKPPKPEVQGEKD